MNERIQELMDQCEEEYSTQNYPCWDMEKFAELIVRECAGLVQGVPTDTMGYHTADQKIKEHFGVK